MPRLSVLLFGIATTCSLASGCQRYAPMPAEPASPATSEVELRIRMVESGLVVPDATAPAASGSSIEERMLHYRVPGVSVAVIEGGRIEWARAYGVREAGGTVPVDTATLFQSASISKPVTTVAALRLVERGRLALDEDVNLRLASWHIPPSPFMADEKVTLRRILTHSAGLSVSGFAGYTPGEPVPTPVQVLDGAFPAHSEPVRVTTVPGSEQRYSGGGFTVAQLLVADAAGRAFETALHDLVLAPAGMMRSTFAQPLPPALRANAASGHDPNGAPLPGRWRIHPELAAAGLWSTPSDLARLAISIQRSAAGRKGGILSRGMAAEMLTPQMGPSGLGFVVLGDGEARIFRHAGSNAGFRARMLAFVEGGRGAVVMTNGDGGTQLVEEILASIARTYRWPQLPRP
ncbi:MAG: Beta-lactamase class C and other penicillin binding proteins [uncultured Gemmatimonadetes bacterium]|uniref:Beta-lactamase class C and other penicillin binding proteins n=1 Tax=uncultured Gemmatimonadota bacterium TaxID=203437 RepID=A0A6J4MX02_9BACT|nr:MAG: Beta-lactamase class C and other penicillin binding proteins [uncultured Gemmatimonadota bacterium]